QVYYESDTYLLGKTVVEEGLQQGVFFQKDDGSVWIDLTDEGLDQKLVLRADGTSVYITQDLGTVELRFRDHPFDRMVYVVGNEQDYHFKVLFAILNKLSRPYAAGLFHLSYGMVDLPSGKMKSREGTVVDADDLIREVVEAAREQTKKLGKIENFTEVQAEELYHMLGTGALKYFLLKVDPKKRMLFDPQESVQLHGDTAVFIQYTHARISKIVRKGETDGIATDQIPPVEALEPSERELIALLTELPAKVALAAESYAPSVVAQYAYDLAKAYNRFYTEVPIFGVDDTELIAFRVTLSATVAQTIRHAMGLLGIGVPERM
ncbi:MAG: arginine--tRNA ligase, partial [Tunicatimonas sp.]